MLKITLWLYAGVLLWGVAFSLICPDGNICFDSSTCCSTPAGYRCCPYPQAVCCSDQAHCCPSKHRCNPVTQMCEKTDEPWLNVPMLEKKTAEKPSRLDFSITPFEKLENNNVPGVKTSSVVHCDNYYICPDGTSCCRHPKGAWFCCPYSPGRCCLDGFHCCPYGYDCDLTYTHCVRGGLKFPFTPKQALTSIPASLIFTTKEKSNVKETPMTALTESSSSHGVIRCDDKFFCPGGSTCCKGPKGGWVCCPYPLGQCCKDGQHCCEYGYNCTASSSSCRRW